MVTINHERYDRSPFMESQNSSPTRRSYGENAVRHNADSAHRSYGVSRHSNREKHDLSGSYSKSKSPSLSISHKNEGRHHKTNEFNHHQTPEFWERRRKMRERAGASVNTQIWESNPPKEDSDSDNDQHTISGQAFGPSLPTDLRILDNRADSYSHKKLKQKNDSHHRSHKHSKKHKKERKKSNKPKKQKRKNKHVSRKSSSSSPSSEYESEVDSEDEKKQFIKQMKDKKRELERKRAQEEEEEEAVGPMLPTAEHSSLIPLDYGRALLPGEGAAMAAYIAEGKRIPRRGEIGLTPEEIESFEKEGYVMSGSRHRRMEAVRLRKENQIYSADEKRALEHFNHAERAKREAKLQAQFKALIKRKLEDKQAAPPPS
ncbi:putative splicing factor, arginine/serine-rich 12 (Serine-arginine-rich-splicing regulatory protein 86) (SRrp86) (Splicing regulatory protein 508) (SRrp508) [Schistosoma mansoni]|uniref:Nkap_C domain-containing protein n=1 Tax=Schistosoma mansoni TaxID=6183 RepID=G4VFH1_SCHMA|nr:putative splicing factor, arginine/serine-rich 12 (Serine-arginine-rich-splicing regulatory protein 86) (SRrp86) (Splicing regulatory protein 508) (SRrp508) [Schistosoma mansoni]|eukprot:XP_018651288.1 putative splicing factor, arginine/serine-rich 12 (Serine-arginine-rich-splicing regulatory protein 86) (SRrp86) (Splicing regulatory protein 508) (SRrp508) [Schistosoma mansoni]